MKRSKISAVAFNEGSRTGERKKKKERKERRRDLNT
jgi:hypothetical protein